MTDELTFQHLMENDLRLLDSQMREVESAIECAFATLEGNMEYTIADKEGEVTALGDNGILELLVEMKNMCSTVIIKARHNVHGKPA